MSKKAGLSSDLFLSVCGFAVLRVVPREQIEAVLVHAYALAFRMEGSDLGILSLNCPEYSSCGSGIS